MGAVKYMQCEESPTNPIVKQFDGCELPICTLSLLHTGNTYANVQEVLALLHHTLQHSCVSSLYGSDRK